MMGEYERYTEEISTLLRVDESFDIVRRHLDVGSTRVCFFYIDGFTKDSEMQRLMQFMLTNDVQISYSKTEGYVPVTEKAQNSTEYVNYLNGSGTDNDLYYDVKIAATKMLIDNVDNTFVTPVFNGSTSLRNAAGQLIESVTKSTRRSEAINDRYIKNLYSEVSSLYRLDQISSTGLPPTPTVSKILLGGLAVTWLSLGAYVLTPIVKKKIKKCKLARECEKK